MEPDGLSSSGRSTPLLCADRRLPPGRCSLLHDFRLALRVLNRNRSFSVGAVLSLAIGIGIATTIFNATTRALINPLAVPNSDQMVTAFSFDRATSRYLSSSYPDYLDLSESVKSLEALSAYVRLPLNVQAPAGTFRLPGEAVSENYFSMLGLQLVLGRDFDPGTAEDRSSVVLSEQLWRSHFGRSPAVLGTSIRINGHPFIIIGVAPARYRGVDLSWLEPPVFWIPLRAATLVLPSFEKHSVLETRSARFLLMVGRLRTETTQKQAQAELDVLMKGLERAHPLSNEKVSAVVLPASRSRFWPGHRATVTRLLSVLSIGTGVFLLLAYANISSLLLGRAVSRTREMAIRLSLGARRWSLVRQFLIESGVLAVCGFALALVITHALNRLMNSFPRALGLPLSLDLDLDIQTVGFCVALSTVGTIVVALIPALRASRVDLIPGLTDPTGNTGSAAPHGLRTTLVLAQIALATLLLVGTGMLYRTLIHAYSKDLGFATSSLVSIEFDVPSERSPGTGRAQEVRRLLDEIRRVPGVRSATLAMNVPLSMMRTEVRVSNGTESSEESVQANYNIVGAGFFGTLGIPMIAGRDFRTGDELSGPRPAVVDEALAEKLWPGRDPVGKRVTLAFGRDREMPGSVIGVARNNRYNSVWDDPSPHVYLPPAPGESVHGNMIVSTHGSAEPVVPAVRRSWQSVARDVSIHQLRTGDEIMKAALSPYRLTAGLLGIFAVGSVLLSFVGLYSVVSMSVLGRSREIAIRIAVGALPRQAVAAVIRNLLSGAMVGLIFGLVCGSYAARWLASAMANVASWDLAVFALVAVFLTIVLLAAALIPALRAARSDPARVFRC